MYQTTSKKTSLAGVGLIVAGLFILYVLFLGSSSPIIDTWALSLRRLAGWSVLCLPLGLDILGLWLIFRDKSQPAYIKPERVFGLILLYLVTALSVHFWVTPNESDIFVVGRMGEGGGLIGAYLLYVLFTTLGQLGTVAVTFAWWIIALWFVIAPPTIFRYQQREYGPYSKEGIIDIHTIRGAILAPLGIGLLLYNFYIIPLLNTLINNLAGFRRGPSIWYVKLWPLAFIAMAAWFLFFKRPSTERLRQYRPEHHPYLRFMNGAASVVGWFVFFFALSGVYADPYGGSMEAEIALIVGVMLFAVSAYIEEVTQGFKHWDHGIATQDKLLGSLSVFAGLMLSLGLIVVFAGFIDAMKSQRD